MKFTNYKIVKSNELIQSRSNFTAMEHRIILLALVQIKPDDEKLKMYKIKMKDVLGGKKNSSNYYLVRKSVEKLQQSLIRVEENNGWKSYSFVIKAQGEYKNNYIEIQFHEDIQKFLLGLKSHYTSYTLGNVINFKRNYSLRIYELCKQYQKIGFRDMKLSYLRILLSLETKYSDFRNFRIKVLNPAISEINKHSDLYVEFEEITQGRKVENIKFIIKNNRSLKLRPKIDFGFANSENEIENSENVTVNDDNFFQTEDCNKEQKDLIGDNTSPSAVTKQFDFESILMNSGNIEQDKVEDNDLVNEKFTNIENIIKVFLNTVGFNDTEILKLRTEYPLQRLHDVFVLYNYNRLQIRSPKAWIRKALSDNYINHKSSKELYDERVGNQSSLDSQKKERLKDTKNMDQSLNVMKIKKFQISLEMKDLIDSIVRDKTDIMEYRKTKKLKPSDMLRFNADISVDDVIKKLEERLEINENLLKKVKKELEQIENLF